MNKLLRARFAKFTDEPVRKFTPELAVPGKFKACVIVPVEVFAVIVAAFDK
jgi:hypothetical protein